MIHPNLRATRGAVDSIRSPRFSSAKRQVGAGLAWVLNHLAPPRVSLHARSRVASAGSSGHLSKDSRPVRRLSSVVASDHSD
jgi:hypothetical protein